VSCENALHRGLSIALRVESFEVKDWGMVGTVGLLSRWKFGYLSRPGSTRALGGLGFRLLLGFGCHVDVFFV
jgi:hypothetical protein